MNRIDSYLNVHAFIVVAKDFSQYEPIFLQMAEDKKTVNAFELADLLEACLPNGALCHSIIITNVLFEQCYSTYIYLNSFSNSSTFHYRLYQKLC